MRRLAGAAATALALAASAASCGGQSTWRPPPPSGPTYVYEFQGFREKSTTVVAAGGGGPAGGFGMGGGGTERTARELHGASAADPLGESRPIDGVRFNEHLGSTGVAVAPAGSARAPAGAR